MKTQTAPHLAHGTWTADPARSTLGFAIRHLGVATVRGAFTAFDACVNAGDVGLHVSGEIDAHSIAAGDPIRDRRLREEVFRTAEHPRLRFVASALELPVGDRGILDGDLTITGVTRRLELDVRAEALADGEVRVRAEGVIARSAYGLDWLALGEARRLLSDRVKVYADVVLVRA